MRKHSDLSPLERDQQEQANIEVDFRAGMSLRKVCRRLRLSPQKVREAVYRGQLLAIQFAKTKFRKSKDGKAFDRQWWTNYRYPVWQFESNIRKYLPKILKESRRRWHLENQAGELDFNKFYRAIRDFLFRENHQLDGRRPIDLLRLGGVEANLVVNFDNKLQWNKR